MITTLDPEQSPFMTLLQKISSPEITHIDVRAHGWTKEDFEAHDRGVGAWIVNQETGLFKGRVKALLPSITYQEPLDDWFAEPSSPIIQTLVLERPWAKREKPPKAEWFEDELFPRFPSEWIRENA